MKTCGIYKIVSPSEKIYIGQSRDIEKRIKDYKSHDCLTQRKLYFSFEKYGFENHKFEIIEECSIEMLNEREMYWINHYQTFNTEQGLNLTSGGSNPNVSEETRKLHSEISKADCYFMRMTPEHIAENTRRIREQHLKNIGSKHTDEAKEKISKGNSGKKRTEEQIQKQSERQTGKELNFSPEHREFLSRSLSERNKERTGEKRAFTDEHLKNLREANKNKIWTEEDRLQASLRKLENPMSEEGKKSMIEKNTGRKRTPEQLVNISEAQKGKKRSPESVAKGIETQKRNRADKEAAGIPKTKNKMSPEGIENLRQAVIKGNTGRKHSEEFKKKQADSMKEYWRLKRELKQMTTQLEQFNPINNTVSDHSIKSIFNRHYILKNWGTLSQ